MRFLTPYSATLALLVTAASAQEVQPELLGLLQACEQTVVTGSPDPMAEIDIIVPELLAGLFRFDGDVRVDGHPMEVQVMGGSGGWSCAFELNMQELTEQPPHPGPTLEAWVQTASPTPMETFLDPGIDARMYFVCDGDATFGAVVGLRDVPSRDRRQASERGVTLSDDAVAIRFRALPMSANECVALNERLDAEDLRGT